MKGPFFRMVMFGVLLIVLSALMISFVVSARHRGKQHHCRNNLRKLGELAHTNLSWIEPEVRGRAYWNQVREVQYYVERTKKWIMPDPNPFVCPFTDHDSSDMTSMDSLTYLGPNYDPTQLVQDRPLAADRPKNHPEGGFVLYYNTSVKEYYGRVDTFQGISDWLED